MVFDYLKEFVIFRSVEEMDEHMGSHLLRYKELLTESEVAIVKKIASHALAYPGVSHLKAVTIADSLQISTKTVYRAAAKLEELGVVGRVPTKKLNGIKGANIYRILPFVPSDVSERENARETDSGKASKPLPRNQSFVSLNLSQTSTLHNIYNRLQNERERKMSCMNEYQRTLYELLMETPIKDELKDGLYQAIVASSMPDFRTFVQTRDALIGIIQDIHAGRLTINTTLRAVLKGALQKTLPMEVSMETVPEQPRRKVEFYDWLTERE